MAKVHIYDRSSIVTSVLRGTKIAALCGLSKVLTKQDVEDAAKSKKVCKACALAVADMGKREGATLHQPQGWVKLLEAETIDRLTQPTVRVSSVRTWDYPLAG
jgi:hypothetical protein